MDEPISEAFAPRLHRESFVLALILVARHPIGEREPAPARLPEVLRVDEHLQVDLKTSAAS